jgi:formylglycine-generating enzyme required for sulfatase activity
MPAMPICAAFRVLVFAACLCIAASALAQETSRLDLGGGVLLDLVKVEPGKFTQGSPGTEKGRGEDETPREVRLTRGFLIGRTPVTRGQWERFVSETPFRTDAERGTSGGYGWGGNALTQRKEFTWRNPGFAQTADHPVCLVTYADAEAFCRWLSGKTGRSVTLPNEAQWEYACRAGTTTPWHNGASDVAGADELAWSKQNAGNTTHPVNSRKPNAWGIHIGGNLSEWCRDWYAPYAAGPATDPLQENPNIGGDKPRRVLRGGSWNRDAKHTRSAARYRVTPGTRNADIGFRVVVMDAPKAAALRARAPVAAPDVELPDNSFPTVETPPVDSSSPSSPTPVVRSRRQGVGPYLCIAGAIGIAGFIAYRILRGLARPSWNDGTTPLRAAGFPVGAPSRAAGERVRIAEDGFWLLLDNVDVGSRVHYGYRLPGAGEEAAGSVLYQPGPQGQFVYTGAAPQYARVTQVEPPGADATWDAGASGVQAITTATMLDNQPPPLPSKRRDRDDDDDQRRSDSGRSPRYPSAY